MGLAAALRAQPQPRTDSEPGPCPPGSRWHPQCRGPILCAETIPLACPWTAKLNGPDWLPGAGAGAGVGWLAGIERQKTPQSLLGASELSEGGTGYHCSTSLSVSFLTLPPRMLACPAPHGFHPKQARLLGQDQTLVINALLPRVNTFPKPPFLEPRKRAGPLTVQPNRNAVLQHCVVTEAPPTSPSQVP